MGLLTRNLVREAIEIALPTIRLMIRAHTWGPQGVVIAVDGPGLDKPVYRVMEELGPEEEWEKNWGQGKNFLKIALAKLKVVMRTGTSTRKAVSEHPWLLEKGDFFYVGGVSEAGLGVVASGAHGDTDETISWIVVNTIWLLCQREIYQRQEKGIKQL